MTKPEPMDVILGFGWSPPCPRLRNSSKKSLKGLLGSSGLSLPGGEGVVSGASGVSCWVSVASALSPPDSMVISTTAGSRRSARSATEGSSCSSGWVGVRVWPGAGVWLTAGACAVVWAWTAAAASMLKPAASARLRMVMILPVISTLLESVSEKCRVDQPHRHHAGGHGDNAPNTQLVVRKFLDRPHHGLELCRNQGIKQALDHQNETEGHQYVSEHHCAGWAGAVDG